MINVPDITLRKRGLKPPPAASGLMTYILDTVTLLGQTQLSLGNRFEVECIFNLNEYTLFQSNKMC